MTFESSARRSVVFAWLMAMGGDVLLAIMFGLCNQDFFSSFVLALLFIEFFPFPIWVMHSIMLWIGYRCGRNKAVAALLAGLVKAKMPKPQEYETSAEGYLDRVAADDKLDIAVRFTAIRAKAEMEALRTAGKLQGAYMLSLLWEQAIAKYADEPITVTFEETVHGKL